RRRRGSFPNPGLAQPGRPAPSYLGAALQRPCPGTVPGHGSGTHVPKGVVADTAQSGGPAVGAVLCTKIGRVSASFDPLSRSFDTAADSYETARPSYPDELFRDLIELAELRPGEHLLEIGCATGKATRPLLERGFSIVCLEPGPRLAAHAATNLAG